MITKENISAQAIKSVFDAAYLACTIDSDGELKVVDRYTCFISVNRLLLSYRTVFLFRSGTSHLAMLEAANKFNSEMNIPRASKLDGNGKSILVLEMNWPYGDGISPKYLVDCLRVFEAAVEGSEKYFEHLLD